MISAAQAIARTEELHALLARYDGRPDTTHVTVVVAQPTSGWSWNYGDVEAQYFIASITKLYTATVVMQLVRDGQVELEAPVGRYLPGDLVSGLNVSGGQDRSSETTVRHLLAHTSGIADYFEQDRRDGGTTFSRVLETDAGWSLAEALEIAKHQMRAKFAPGQPARPTTPTRTISSLAPLSSPSRAKRMRRPSIAASSPPSTSAAATCSHLERWSAMNR